MIDFSAVPFLDSTAANTIAGFARKAQRIGLSVAVTGASPSVRKTLLAHGARPPLVDFRADIEIAVAEAKSRIAQIA